MAIFHVKSEHIHLYFKLKPWCLRFLSCLNLNRACTVLWQERNRKTNMQHEERLIFQEVTWITLFLVIGSVSPLFEILISQWLHIINHSSIIQNDSMPHEKGFPCHRQIIVTNPPSPILADCFAFTPHVLHESLWPLASTAFPAAGRCFQYKPPFLS